jgi:D-sedoheptulose 7-phosphate isomerase
MLKQWVEHYIDAQVHALQKLPADAVGAFIDALRTAHEADRQVFAVGNGGSAANASHFATDLGKGASDALGKRFRVLSLTDNVAWLTAIGNDYAYADVFVRQLENFAHAGDVLIAVSVSGASPNVLRAVDWANEHGLTTLAMTGQRGGFLRERAGHCIVIEDGHYGRVEDIQMTLLHMLCYAFMERDSGCA